MKRKVLPPKAFIKGSVADRIDFLRELAKHPEDLPLSVLSHALNDRSPSVRGSALSIISDLKIREALGLVEPLLSDLNAEVRYDAAECVGVLLKDRPSIHRGLTRLLRDPNALVRTQAIGSLAYIEDKSAVRPIARLLNDNNEIVRSHAASALGQLGDRKFIGVIRTALAREKSVLAKIGLWEAMILYGERSSLTDLLHSLQSGNYRNRCAAGNTLETLSLAVDELELAVKALRHAARHPLAFADASTAKRVCKVLRSRLLSRCTNEPRYKPIALYGQDSRHRDKSRLLRRAVLQLRLSESGKVIRE